MEAGSRNLAASGPGAAADARADAGGRVRAVHRATLAVYGVAIFTGSALVFVIEPMVAKMLLPSFGGTPAVWAISLVFFQVVLLAGYSFAHFSIRLLGVRRQPIAQLVLLLVPLAVLPIALPANAAPGSHDPNTWLLWVLALTAGLPFFAITTASPVLQRWFSVSGHAASRDPYFLYAAGNAGSLIGLLAYPILIEPRLTLAGQARMWAMVYAVFVVLAAICATRVLGARVAEPTEVAAASSPIAWRVRLRWIAMAAIPSALMIGTSTYLSTDVAAVPLLWVIPLALYLLSFVIAFGRRSRLTLDAISSSAVATSLAVAGCLLLLLLAPSLALPIWLLVFLHGANLFVIALLVHRRLALERPPADRLTEFYLLLSVGGVLGGAFAALVAPQIFPTVAEYPLAIVLALLLRPGPFKAKAGVINRYADIVLPFAVLVGILGAAKVLPEGGTARLGLLAAVGVVALFRRRPFRFALGVAALLLLAAIPKASLVSERNFFGVLLVIKDGSKHVLFHDTTVHGIESYAPGQREVPLAYYSRSGPLGQVFAAYRLPRVGAIGLGSGAVAAYGRPGDRYTFYEINPAMARIASDPRYFDYLHGSKAKIRIVIGDGRLELAKAPPRSYDLIVLDAFSSDSVPVHLLTREAVRIYLSKLRPNGLIAFHISNRYFDLEPVIGGVAHSLGLAGLYQAHVPTPAARKAGAAPSQWVVVARRQLTLAPLVRSGKWRQLDESSGEPVWTDQYSNILSVVRWLR
jgi:spermidine synthase